MTHSTNARNREQRTAYEVLRPREPGKKGVAQQPTVEEFAGLDRARLAALGYALDGPTSVGDKFTGTIIIHQVFYIGTERVRATLVDVIDERVAFRVLNELTLPRADQLSYPVERLQEEANRLAHLGI